MTNLQVLDVFTWIVIEAMEYSGLIPKSMNDDESENYDLQIQMIS